MIILDKNKGYYPFQGLLKHLKMRNRRSKQDQNKVRLCYALQRGGRQSQKNENFILTKT